MLRKMNCFLWQNMKSLGVRFSKVIVILVLLVYMLDHESSMNKPTAVPKKTRNQTT